MGMLLSLVMVVILRVVFMLGDADVIGTGAVVSSEHTATNSILTGPAPILPLRKHKHLRHLLCGPDRHAIKS